MILTFQTVVKGIVCILAKEKLTRIENQQMIWNLSDISNDKSLRDQIVQQYLLTHKVQKLFVLSVVGAAVSRCIMLPLGYDVMPLTNVCSLELKGFWFYELVELVAIILSATLYAALDLLFVSACSILMTQLKIANHVLKNMDHTEASVSEEQKEFVRKYCKLLEYCEAS